MDDDSDMTHEQQVSELYDGDPLDYPCEECGAQAGEECRVACTGQG